MVLLGAHESAGCIGPTKVLILHWIHIPTHGNYSHNNTANIYAYVHTATIHITTGNRMFPTSASTRQQRLLEYLNQQCQPVDIIYDYEKNIRLGITFLLFNIIIDKETKSYIISIIIINKTCKGALRKITLKIHIICLISELNLTRFNKIATQGKGPDGKWIRKPLVYRTRHPEIYVSLVFKHVHSASIYKK